MQQFGPDPLSLRESMRHWSAQGEKYGETAFAAGMLNPNLGNALLDSLQHRNEMLSMPGIRQWFSGIEELIKFLNVCQKGFASTADLGVLEFMVVRLSKNFSASVDLALGGHMSAAFDTMRDVMETEGLLNDFHHNRKHIDEWLSLSVGQRNDKFSPNQVRIRESRRQGLKDPSDLPTAGDYRNHCQTLHVTPQPYGTELKGIHSYQPIMSQIPFWEIFFHGGRSVEVLFQFVTGFAKDIQTQLHSLSLEQFYAARKEVQNRLDGVVKAGQDQAPDPYN